MKKKLSKRTAIKLSILKQLNDEAWLLDGMEDALVGWAYSKSGMPVAVYSGDKMVDIYMKRDGMKRHEAWEFLEYNPVRAIPYYGDNGPIIIGGRF